MSVDIIMPKMGESIMEGTILKWHKQPGDKVEVDETILEISTDKVDTEVPSPEAGIVSELLFNEGDVVEVGKVIAKLNSNGSSSASDKPEEEVSEKKVEIKLDEPAKEVKSETKTESPAASSNGDGKFYSPLVLNIAQKEGIGFEELEGITGTGVGGRVSKKDILEYLQNRTSKPAATPAQAVKQPDIVPPKAETKITASEEKKIELPKQTIDYNE